MNNTNITIVYCFRDRPVERLINSVQSIMKFGGGKKCAFIVVDYGSSESYRMKLEKVCQSEGVRLIRSEAEGRPWSRAIAMNIGILAAETDIFISTDIDMIFDFDVVSEVLSTLERSTKVHCRPYWLPPSNKKEKAMLGDHAQLGGLLCMYRDDFISLGCFNERIKFWGAEDTELDIRALKYGNVTRWLPKELKMYHVWHPVSHGFCDVRPAPSIIEDQTLMIRTLVSDKESDDLNIEKIGIPLRLEDRPILKLIRSHKNNEFKTYSGHINFELISQVIDDLKSGHAVFVETGRRIRYEICGVGQVNSLLTRIFLTIDRVFGRVGFQFGLKKNAGQDWIFLLIEELHPLIEDYYWDYNYGCYFYPRRYQIK